MPLTHRKTFTPEYASWKAMRNRCNYKGNKSYSYYGGRGITVCERWDSFVNFLADMGSKPEGYTLDRIDVNGNYEPSNCRWASKSQQLRNTSRAKVATLNGKTQSIHDWVKELGLKYTTVKTRIWNLGWTPEQALMGKDYINTMGAIK